MVTSRRSLSNPLPPRRGQAALIDRVKHSANSCGNAAIVGLRNAVPALLADRAVFT